MRRGNHVGGGLFANVLNNFEMVGCGKVICHMLVDRSCLSVRIDFPLSITLSALVSSKHLYPEFHNFSSEISDQLSKTGTMCYFLAAGCCIGRSISVTWVNSMMVPLGGLMLMGFGVIHLLSYGQAILTYVLVQAKLVVKMGVPVYVVD